MAVPCVTHLWWHFFIGVGMHDGVLPPLMAPARLLHLSAHILTGSTFFATPSKGFYPGDEDGQVLGMGGAANVGRLNDAGLIVPHVSFPLQPMLVLTILLGESKVLLGASKVQILTKNWIFGEDETAIGCCFIPWVPISLNLGCNDPIPLPTDIVIAPNDTLVGVSGADFATAFFDLAMEIALSAVLAIGGGLLRGKGKKAMKFDAPVGPSAAKKSMKKGRSKAGLADAAWRSADNAGKAKLVAKATQGDVAQGVVNFGAGKAFDAFEIVRNPNAPDAGSAATGEVYNWSEAMQPIADLGEAILESIGEAFADSPSPIWS